MVFFFTSDVVSPPVKLFMGLDKYESENLRFYLFLTHYLHVGDKPSYIHTHNYFLPLPL